MQQKVAKDPEFGVGDGDGGGDLSDCDDDEGDEEDYDMTSQLYCCFVISQVNTHVQRHTSCVTSHKSHVARDHKYCSC